MSKDAAPAVPATVSPDHQSKGESGPRAYYVSPSQRIAAPVGRLLLITYHFPPGTAVGGVRWQKLAAYAVERGWLIDVVAVDPQMLERRDDGRLASLPAGMRVFGFVPPAPSWLALPRTIWRRARRLRKRDVAYAATALGRDEVSSSIPFHVRAARAYYAWLDFVEGTRLAEAAARVALVLARDNDYAAVISSGPPHAAHKSARLVAKRKRLPFIADFRDPWSLVERVPKDAASRTWFRLVEKQEREIVESARLLIMNTDRATNAMRAKYPEAASRIITIFNGSDRDEPLPSAAPSSKFSVRFAGTIYLDRDPRLVFRAASRVVRELRLSPSDFELSFVGDVADFGGTPIQDMAKEEGIEGYVELRPSLPRSEAMRFLAEGTVLLNLPQDSESAIPAKVFEYVGFNAWLLVLARRDSATEQLLRGTHANVVDPQDVEGIVDALRTRYLQFKEGIRPTAVGADGRFDRSRQAAILLDWIANITGRGAATPSR